MKPIQRLAALLLPLATPFIAASADQAYDSSGRDRQQASEVRRSYSPLVEKVRRATGRYKDINVAKYDGWVVGTPCVSGPNTGAMGVHLIEQGRLGDDVIDGDLPEALIYEPMGNGNYRLVGVEFIMLAPKWDENHAGTAPTLEGHLMNYVGAPNRYGLPAFYELHVWAWEHNPEGNFADWNTQVNCDKAVAPSE
jgi:hypothetical protein